MPSDGQAEATLRGAYWALREEGVGTFEAMFHAPIFYVVAYRHVGEFAKSLEETEVKNT